MIHWRLDCIWIDTQCFATNTGRKMQANITPAEARGTAKEAYIYGFPMVDSYRIQNSYFIDRESPAFKAPYNEISSFARVFTPEDTIIQTPNSDRSEERRVGKECRWRL